MKITENINLAGLIFTIDQDALLKLQNYLNSIERYFAIKEEGKEVVADIEGRIAELFETKLNKSKEVISIEDVNQIIGIMGMPEEFMNEAQTESERSASYSELGSKKLYRSADDKVLGGVCGGLGAYFNIDPVIFRLIFVLALLFSVGFLIYIILWIVLPEARTFAQKLEMKGYKVNISSIHNNVKGSVSS
ncbi:MAG: PspC domain-containing protein [Bacteroidales bacterium]|nr:PspC domain-containing protein [Bacteroidales bacterium]MBN2756117.1 PspC domain-containing protein [Bacteroidales bacterium]